MIIPAQVPSIGVPAAASSRSGSARPSRSMPERHRRRLAAGDDQPVEALEVGGHAHLAHLGAERRAACGVRLEVALEGEDADQRLTAATSRGRRAAAARSSLRVSSDSIAPPRPSEARGDALGVLEVRRRLDDRARRGVAGSSDLKMPEPTNTPSAPSCIISAASAGVAMPPAQNSTTGSLPSRGDLAHEVERRLVLLGGGGQLGVVHHGQRA